MTEEATTATEPTYVDYGALTTGPPPFRCSDSKMWVFFLEADHDRLVAQCDDVFNKPSGGAARYHPLGSHVMLTFGTMNVTSIPPPYDTMGIVVELSAALWVMTVKLGKLGPIVVPEKLASFIPTIFVDNPISLAGGREIYGFNKAWGWTTLPDADTLDHFHLDVFGGDFGKGVFAGRHPLIDLRRNDLSEPLNLSPVGDLGDALKLLIGDILPADGDILLPGLSMAESLYLGIHGLTMTTVFLKQFRSAVDGTKASQQRIIESQTKFDAVSVQLVNHEYDFVLEELDSAPFAQQLGLKPTQTVPFGLQVEADFVQEAGTVVWDSGA